MMARMKKAAGGFKTTTATALHNATDFIAACARQASAKASFGLKPHAGIGRQQYRAVTRCDGLLKPGDSFGWNWTRRGETVASLINLKVTGMAVFFPLHPAASLPDKTGSKVCSAMALRKTRTRVSVV